jgi:hypothetical protein
MPLPPVVITNLFGFRDLTIYWSCLCLAHITLPMFLGWHVRCLDHLDWGVTQSNDMSSMRPCIA